MQELEKKLKYDLFLGGMEMNDEDVKLYEIYKDANVQKESYSHIYKWRLMVAKQLSQQNK